MENLENEVLQKIKFALLCKNEAIAIRLLEQYRFDVTEEMYSEEEVRFIKGMISLYWMDHNNKHPLNFKEVELSKSIIEKLG